jgi:hypothetical protein
MLEKPCDYNIYGECLKTKLICKGKKNCNIISIKKVTSEVKKVTSEVKKEAAEETLFETKEYISKNKLDDVRLQLIPIRITFQRLRKIIEIGNKLLIYSRKGLSKEESEKINELFFKLNSSNIHESNLALNKIKIILKGI